MQRFLTYSPILNLTSFSIHKRIEGGATRRFTLLKQILPMVSVSTSGSKGVQQGKDDLVIRANVCFSIHKRIEGGATPEDVVVVRQVISFSIHKRIEGGATYIPDPK